MEHIDSQLIKNYILDCLTHWFEIPHDLNDNIHYDSIGKEHISSDNVLHIECVQFKNLEALCRYSEHALTSFDTDNVHSFLNSHDWFAVCFCLLTRAEEYMEYERDVHGRFSAKESMLYRLGLLQIPVVDLLMNEFVALLNTALDISIEPQSNYRYHIVPTFDIDRFYKIKGIPFLQLIKKSLGAIFRGRFKECGNNMSAYFGWNDDVYQRFELIASRASKFPQAYVFILYPKDNRIRYDFSNSRNFADTHKIIKQLSSWAQIGIHPSYRASENLDILEEERESLSQVLGQINHSRFHFLRFSLPDSYRKLIDAGIKNDHSMGFADDVGFRAGTARSFYWFDLDRGRRSDLRVYPFCVMDATMRHYQDYNVAQAMELINRLKTSCAAADVPFTYLWHNSSFDPIYYPGWTEVFDYLHE